MFNQVEDLGALLAFLRAYPFDSAPFFNSHISAPLGTKPEKALSTLKKLFRCTSLRRTKDAVIDDLQLRPRSDVVHEVQLSHNERRLYNDLKKSLSYIFHLAASDTDKISSGSNVLQTITRLRQFCNHGVDLLPREMHDILTGSFDQEQVTRALMTKSKTCDSCDLQLSVGKISKVTLNAIWCGHTICSRCLLGRQISNQSCPLCFNLDGATYALHDAQHRQSIDTHRDYQPSSKVSALLENLSAEQRIYPPVKRYV